MRKNVLIGRKPPVKYEQELGHGFFIVETYDHIASENIVCRDFDPAP